MPPFFSFAVKMNRVITHVKHLVLDEESTDRLKYIIDNLKGLKDNLGPILVQLPPSVKYDIKRLDFFCEKIRELSKRKLNEPIIAIEFRDKRWLKESVFEILERHRITYCISDSPDWPTAIRKTTDIVYLRLHGQPDLFSSLYTELQLIEWLRKVRVLNPKKLYIFFNNDVNGYAVINAEMMKKLADKGA